MRTKLSWTTADGFTEIRHMCEYICLCACSQGSGQGDEVQRSAVKPEMSCSPAPFFFFVNNPDCLSLRGLPDAKSSRHFSAFMSSDELTPRYFPAMAVNLSHTGTTFLAPEPHDTDHQRPLQARLTSPKSALRPKSKMTAARSSQVCRQGFPWMEP